MTKKKWIIGGFAVFSFIILLVYFFIPTGRDMSSGKEKERRVSFLKVDDRWADSLLGVLSLEEKAAMIILYQPSAGISADSVILSDFVPGGYLFSSAHLVQRNEKGLSRSLLFAGFDEAIIPGKKKSIPSENTLFDSPEMFFSFDSDSILRESKSLFAKSGKYFDLDGFIFPFVGDISNKKRLRRIFEKDSSFYRRRIFDYEESLADQKFLTGSALLGNTDAERNSSDSSYLMIQSHSRVGLPLVFLDSLFPVKDLQQDEITKFLKREFSFEGLCISLLSNKEILDDNQLEKLLNGGSDMLLTSNFIPLHFKVMELLRHGKLTENLLNAKVKKVLLAKTWSRMKKKKVGYDPVKSFTAYEKTFPRRIRKATFTLVRNEKSHLPIRNVTNNRIVVIHLGNQPENFTRQLYHYLPKEQTVPTKAFKDLNNLKGFNAGDYKRYHTVIVTINGNILKNGSVTEKLDQLSANNRLVILNFQFPENLTLIAKYATVIQIWGNSSVEYFFAAQSVFGGVGFYSRIPMLFDKKLNLDKAKKLAQSRLQYTIPEDIGISSDSLAAIDYIIEEGIRNKAFPAAQVFFAIDGKVFYNKSFGTHTYTDRQEVKLNDLFDMASVTKVAASTIIAMSAYERKLYNLNDSLYKHLPDTLKNHLRGPSTLRNITFRQILIHETGLAAGQPIIKYIRYRDSLDNVIGRFDKYYCDEPDEYYRIQVADKFFMEREQADTIWYAMNRMEPDESPSYRYSDANMNLLYKMLDAKIKNRWQYYLDSLFYKPMGMFNTCYLPIQKEIEPERIVPTENDRYWRKQLLRGYVHDPTAALFGGVAGNAGLFSTAEDMGILFQMLLFGGSYGGNQYFKKETVELFSSQQEGTHRGLGFNRQVKGNTYGCSPYASENTFGHTGFTGISVWADKSINLIYVSCTNRVHPDGENKKIINLGTTKRIHNVVYEQLKYVIPDKISLEY